MTNPAPRPLGRRGRPYPAPTPARLLGRRGRPPGAERAGKGAAPGGAEHPAPDAPGGAEPLRPRPGSATTPTPTPHPHPSPWPELLRLSALPTAPGDALLGAAALATRPHRGTASAVAASLCLYAAGMALNDWADREEDAVDRPHRPIPSGRISPAAALTASCALTAAGLTLAGRAGRPALAVATALTATIWAYDLKLKHTPAAPAAMAAARALDVLMGAAATVTTPHPGRAPAHPSPARTASPAPFRTALLTALRAALPSAALLGAHTYAVTEVSRHEAQGGSTGAPLAALAVSTAVAAATTPALRPALPPTLRPSTRPTHHAPPVRPTAPTSPAPLTTPAATAFATSYFRTTAKPLLHAALNPSPPLTQRAVGGGIRAMIPLQAALAARSGAPGTAAALMLLAPLARRLARKVSPT
ncbi:SCO3242 family prenyltransferase [Streptomyces sp. NPDC004111]|uniref:SCO3242 family prenyltransferase n=1 Tax=Streptomyces sp. NPDC004111 TaxID=3364690 RepID=UPI0036B5E640